jgi:hypothetical protein
MNGEFMVGLHDGGEESEEEGNLKSNSKPKQMRLESTLEHFGLPVILHTLNELAQ